MVALCALEAIFQTLDSETEDNVRIQQYYRTILIVSNRMTLVKVTVQSIHVQYIAVVATLCF